jgi:hypothetical protein
MHTGAPVVRAQLMGCCACPLRMHACKYAYSCVLACSTGAILAASMKALVVGFVPCVLMPLCMLPRRVHWTMEQLGEVQTICRSRCGLTLCCEHQS